ncbi:LruC domain-containing protein [bacterium]|nr:LruC domain-containing protein [bacterium]
MYCVEGLRTASSERFRALLGLKSRIAVRSISNGDVFATGGTMHFQVGRLAALLTILLALCGSRAFAVGDASTNFQLFVPPNNDKVGRDVAIIVTNVSPFTTTVDLVDDGADGDTDDTVLGITLTRGQSYVRYIKDGAVNDDAGGKWDGDYFLVTSQDPVVVQMSTKSDWQWDFVPAENKTMRGQSFFIYSPSTSVSQRDVNLMAYEDDTEVYVLDITNTPVNVTGLTSVNLSNPVEVLKTTLDSGQDLIGLNNLGIDILDPGRSYWIRSSKPVTCQYGSLVGNGRDGGGFVPSENGFASGERFYFFIPRDAADEREVRIVSFSDSNTVAFSGWNKATRQWTPIANYQLNRFGHADWVESGTDYPIYRLECTPGKKISVFAASWLEAKGLSGTKDIASFASSESGYGAGKEFLVYLPQPGTQNNVKFGGQAVGSAGHLFIFGHVAGTTYTVVDADTQGRLFSRSGTVAKGGYVDVRMNPAEFAALNKPSEGLRPYLKVSANHLVTVLVTNFNDNWMTFTPSVVLPNPIVTVTAGSDVATIGEQTCIQIRAVNAGSGSLTNGLLEVPLDPAVTYVSSTASIAGMGQPAITTNPDSGGQLLTWEGYTIPSNGTLDVSVCFSVNARRVDNSRVKNKDFLSLPALVRGLGTGVPTDQGGEFETFTGFSSAVLTVNDASQTNVSGLAATIAGTAINVTWQTGREPDLGGFKVYRSTSGDGPFTLLNTTIIPGTGDALNGARYQYTDRPSNLGLLYYYRLEMIDDSGTSSFFGPVSVLAEDRTPPAAPTIVNLLVGDGSVSMGITGGDADGDLKGYQIFRSDALNGIYTKLTPVLLNPGPVYTDNTAGNGQTFYYKAKAVDTNGNTSDFSGPVQAIMPSSSSTIYTLAYEDQVGPGKNDWDYNDWVVQVRSNETFAQGGVASVDVTLESLARGARYRNAFAFRFRANGAWSAEVRLYEDRNATDPFETRTSSGSGLVDLPIFADTYDALPPAEGDDFTNTLNRQNPSTLGRVARITITLASPTANPSQLRHRAPFDPYLTSRLGEVHQASQGVANSTEVVTFWPESPLLGFNLDYVLAVPSASWHWPLENQKIWDAYPNLFANYMLSGRQQSTTWYEAANRNSAKTYNWFPFATTKALRDSIQPSSLKLVGPAIDPVQSFGTPFVASLKAISYADPGSFADTIVLAGADGQVRLVDANGAPREGWPISANSFRATPAIGRLSADDGNPVLVTAEERYDGAARVIAWELTPEPILRWQFETGESVKSAPVIADLDGDGAGEVLALTSGGQLHVLHADGTPLTGSPVSVGEPVWNDKNILSAGAPVLADVDGDGRPEIFVVSPTGLEVHGLTASLGALPGWPRTLTSPIIGGVAASRVAGSNTFAIVGASLDGTLMSWDALGRVNPGFPVDLGAAVTVPIVCYRDEIADRDMIVATTTGGVVRLYGNNGAAEPGWPQVVEGEIFASPVIGDLDGDAIQDVLVVTMTGQVMAWRADGTLIDDFVYHVPGAVQSTPLLADLDGDSRTEVYLATATGDLVSVEANSASPLGPSVAFAWGSLTGVAETNASALALTIEPIPSVRATRDELVEVILGIAAPDVANKIYDLNLDGVIDAADLMLLP